MNGKAYKSRIITNELQKKHLWSTFQYSFNDKQIWVEVDMW